MNLKNPMPANASYEYTQAEKRYLLSQTDEEKLLALEEMIKTMPQHKSAEALRANLRTRYKKLKEKLEERRQRKKAGRKSGIKKEGLQAALIGLTNSGKSSILPILTNAKPEISIFPYTTREPLLGTLDYNGVKIQIVDLPAIESEYFDHGIVNTTDLLLMIITNIEDIAKIEPFLKKVIGKQLIIFNKIDTLNETQKRKIEATLKSKKINFILFSSKTKENIEQLKEKIFSQFNIIRIYTKEPHKQADSEPIIMNPESTVEDVAEKIFKGFSSQVKEARVTGPSSKFPNQKVGLSHTLKDKDIVEFKTR